MARMIPSRIQFRQSGAEVELFRRLRDELPQEFTVLHHVPWVRPDPSRRNVEGEADFVVVHPELGALVLEVKGGELRYNAESNLWYQRSIGRDDERPCPDPFQQAADGARAIAEFVRRDRRGGRPWGPVGHGVCFLRVVFDAKPLPARRAELVIDGRHLRDVGGLEERVLELFAFFRPDSFKQGQRGSEAFVEALNHDLAIEQPLGIAAEDADRAIAELSAQQYRIIRLLRHRRRLAISGPAGSGKTLLALERARDLARGGANTLLLCFNRPLADHLAAQVGSEAGLEVANFHQLCHRLATRARLIIPTGRDEFISRSLPLALEAIDRLGAQYDAIIVDEGQVIDEEWWVAIDALLRGPDEAVLWVFYDDNQVLYDRPRGLPEGLDHQPLDEVWRNSKQIHEWVMRYYRGEPVHCLGPDGPQVEVVRTNGSLQRELSRVLHRLIKVEHVRTDDVVVLTPRNVKASAARGQIGAFKVTDAPRGETDVRLSSIYRFLGLEAKAVVVCEMRPTTHQEHQELMYVALSRARALLVLLEDPPSTEGRA